MNNKRIIENILLVSIACSGCTKNMNNNNIESSSDKTTSIVESTSSLISSSTTEESSIEESSSITKKDDTIYEYVNIFNNRDEIVKKQTDLSKPRIELIKDSYSPNEAIIVNGYNVSSKDWVGVFPLGGEPGGMDSLNWNYISSGSCSLNATVFKDYTEYYVYLLENDGYHILDYAKYSIVNKYTNKYEVDNIRFAYEEEENEFYLALTPKTKVELSYEIYWAKDNKRLENYSYLKKFKKASDKRFNVSCGKYLYAPSEATQIEIKILNSAGDSYFVDIDDSFKLKESNYLYSFNVFSDLHVKSNTSLQLRAVNLMNALNAAYCYNRNSKGLFLVGDSTNDGTRDAYEYLKSILDVYEERSNTPINYILGNHEYIYDANWQKQIGLFKEFTSLDDTYYATTMEGSSVIVFASDTNKGEGTVSKDHINWIKEKLDAADKTKPIYVFFHQPLINTTAGSYVGQNWYGMDTGEDIKELFANYPNTFVFTGHTHWELESLNTIQVNENVTYVNDASVGYLWNDDDKGEPGSEGLFVDVYEDYIVINGMDFVTNKWLPYAMFCIPLSK